MPTESQQWQKLLHLADNASPLEVCRAFDGLAVALAPVDLYNLPFYAMPTSALNDSLQAGSRHTGGWFSTIAYHWCKPFLSVDRGPGPTILVHDVVTPEAARDLAAQAVAVLAASGETATVEEMLAYVRPPSLESLLGTLTHELAHALESIVTGEFAERSDVFEGRAASTMLRRMVARAQVETEPDPAIDCHGLPFTRIVAHLDYRLRQGGVFSTRLNTAGERYAQRPYSDCYAALGSELAKCRRMSFQEIVALPMPPAFAACGALQKSG